MHHITEDTPPDMLAGAMDLVVRLPDGRDVNMAVERSTPMMDLLVHLTTANKLKPSDHLLQALDMSTDRTLPYKPNTPIGALDTQRVRVYPKGSGKGLAPRVPSGQQPFESTFRLQVHLPRNQFCVIRVGKYVLLEDIMKKVCEEKNLDPKKFEFRHPANIDKVLDPKRTLNDYEITEITVVHRGGHLGQALSSTDIMALQREDERRKMQAKTGGGVLNLIFKRGRNSMGSGSISSDTRSISPTQSDDSRSVTPPAIQPPILKSPSKESPNRPKPPQRKRRPAPKPPQITQTQSLPEKILPEVAETPNHENGLTICHSRNSSDSSGYHEASILSDNCNTTLPRRPKSIGINTSSLNNSNTSMEKSDFRKSTGNLVNMSAQSKSTISLSAAGRKKKAPPPPLSSTNSVTSISSPPSSVNASIIQDSTSLSSKQPSIVSTLSEEIKIEAPEIVAPSFKEEPKILDDDADWQYTLPSPPTAFRDSSPTNFTDVTNYDTVTFNNLTSNSVITSPALYEKLENITRPETDTISETSFKKSQPPQEVPKAPEIPKDPEIPEAPETPDSKEDKEEVLTSKYLSLETLEKRKSLVLERELASLKNNEIKSQRDSLKTEIEEVLQNRSRSATLSRTNSQNSREISSDSILPNFKITTYDQPKNKINIFEDDSIRSSNYEAAPKPSRFHQREFFAKRNSMDDFMFKKPEVPLKFSKKNDDTLETVSRSESFSASAQKHIWNRASPVKRSKSHVSLDKYNKEEEVRNDESPNLHKSNSLYNVSGLQSLEVMRMILPKLGNTPPNSPSSEDKQPSFEQKSQTLPYIPPKPEPIVTTTSQSSSTSIPTRKYQYSGPPAINFATWSDRPKTQVSIKEDTDYKFNNIKAKFNNTQSYPSVNIRVNSKDQVDSGKINIKINEEPVPQPGNVVIKIGCAMGNPEKVQKNSLYTRFLNQTTAVGYRKPLGNINGVDKPRPHSIAFDSSCPDLSRVPIVRAVELKKTFKDTPSNNNNKSITQIMHDSSSFEDGGNRNSSIYLSNENINKPEKPLSVFVSRGNSFARNSNPVVKGFLPFTPLRRTEIPEKPPQTNTNLFEINLRKTNNRHSLPVEMQVPVPPPAPKLPKLFAKKAPVQRQLQVSDPRDQLLESIRNFGGKSGLKTVK